LKTKKEIILKLLANSKLNIKQIAKEVGTTPENVRNVKCHSKKEDGGKSQIRKHRKNYRMNNPERKTKDNALYYQRARRGKPALSRKKYTKEDVLSILGYFHGTDRKLAEEIGRSLKAIQVKRSFLKKEGFGQIAIDQY
jgi:hypothetical protein